MKKKLYFLTILILIVTLSTPLFSPRVSAAYSYYNSYSHTSWFTKYNMKVYRDPNWFNVYYGNPALSSGFEYKNNTKIVLSQTRTFSIGSQTKKTLNAGVNFSGFGVPAKVGGSIEKTNSASWGISTTTQREVNASAPKGYYSYNVLINTYKIRIDRRKNKDNSGAGSITFQAPRSQPYRSLVYNPSNASYNGVSRY